MTRRVMVIEINENGEAYYSVFGGPLLRFPPDASAVEQTIKVTADNAAIAQLTFSTTCLMSDAQEVCDAVAREITGALRNKVYV